MRKVVMDVPSSGAIIGAAKAIGASEAAIAKITKLRNEFIVANGKIAKTKEYQAASKVLADANKAKDQDAIAKATTKLKDLVKPAWETFYKGAEEALGKESYAAFVKKLPDWAKV